MKPIVFLIAIVTFLTAFVAQAERVRVQGTATISSVVDQIGVFTFDLSTTNLTLTIVYDDAAPFVSGNAIPLESFVVTVGEQVFTCFSNQFLQLQINDTPGEDNYDWSGDIEAGGMAGLCQTKITYQNTAFSGLQLPTPQLLDLGRPDLISGVVTVDLGDPFYGDAALTATLTSIDIGPVNPTPEPLGTGFTYQGLLRQAGGLVDGPADFEFSLWDSETSGGQLGETVTLTGVNVSQGLFSVCPDFGAEVFDGRQAWMQIKVGTTTLSPRQPLKATPYALQTRGLFVDENGGLTVNGDFQVVNGSKNFAIDHPLDPVNKALLHNAVEGPGYYTHYHGTIVLDANGEAEVRLPDYFEALNKEPSYQLTCVGGYSPVYVAAEISGNAFKVAGGQPGLKVSWQVHATRNDPYARDNPYQAEVEKSKPNQRRYYQP